MTNAGSPPPDADLPGSVAQIPSRLSEEIYNELRAIARRYLRNWRPGQSTEATALVHEAWLRMGSKEFAVFGRKAFLALAALNIRRILIERYRAQRSLRRGGDRRRVPLFESILLDAGPTWAQRYRSLLASQRLVILGSSSELPAWVREKSNYSAWQRNNLWTLQTARCQRPGDFALLALWDGNSGDGPGGTSEMVRLFRKHGANVVLIDTRELFCLS